MSKPKAAAISRDKWIHAIQSNAGVLMFIATELGLNRHTVARYRDKHEWVQRAFKEAVEMAVDAAEFCDQAAT